MKESDCNSCLDPTHSLTLKKFTYWVKYAGIVDGNMGILTRKRCIFHSEILPTKRHNFNDENIKTNKDPILNPIEEQKISNGRTTKLIKVKLPFDLNKISKHRLNKSRNCINEYSKKRISNGRTVISYYSNTHYRSFYTTKKLLPLNSSKINTSERLLGIPNPNKYDVHMITNSMRSKKLHGIHRLKFKRNIDQIISQEPTIRITRLKSSLNSMFSNEKLRERLKNYLLVRRNMSQYLKNYCK